MEKSKNIYGIYDTEGKVKDPEIAREMANVEKPYREQKRVGIFGPSQETVRKGERSAEDLAEQLWKEKLRKDVISSLNYLVDKVGKNIGSEVIGYSASNPRITVEKFKMNLDLTDEISIEFVGSGIGTGMEGMYGDRSTRIKVNGVDIRIDMLTPDVLMMLSRALQEKAGPYLSDDKIARELDVQKSERILGRHKDEEAEKIKRQGDAMKLLEETAKRQKEQENNKG